MNYGDQDFNLKGTWLDKEKDSSSKSKNPGDNPDFMKEKKYEMDSKMQKNLLNDLYGFKSHKPVVSGKVPKSISSTKKTTVGGAGGGNADIVSAMAARLTKLEALCNAQRMEIKEKAEIIEKFEKENKLLKAACSEDSQARFEAINTENKRLKKQAQEMENFLADYGLKWVGTEGSEQNKGDFNKEAAMRDIEVDQSVYRCNLPQEIDMVIMERRVQELNILIESDGPRVVKEKGGIHKFKKHEDIPITFFKNGLLMKGFPFRPYSSKQAQSILSDILEGYFPYDLKSSYPDGVPLKVINQTGEMYVKSEYVGDQSKMRDLSSLQKSGNDPISKDDFLKKLPANVIKGGKIIPVREEIAKKFEDSSNAKNPASQQSEGVIEVDTHATSKGMDEDKIATLRVRTENNKRVLIIKLLEDDTIATLKKYTDDHCESALKNYEIWTTFPRKKYDPTGSETLKDLDLVPNAALILRPAAP